MGNKPARDITEVCKHCPNMSSYRNVFALVFLSLNATLPPKPEEPKVAEEAPEQQASGDIPEPEPAKVSQYQSGKIHFETVKVI